MGEVSAPQTDFAAQESVSSFGTSPLETSALKGQPTQFRAAPPLQLATAEKVSEDAADVGEIMGTIVAEGPVSAPVQAKFGNPVQRKDPKSYVVYKVTVTKSVTAEEFKVLAMQQIFGGPVKGTWELSKTVYTPADSPVSVKVDTALLNSQRSQVNRAKGIDVDDQSGGVKGAGKRKADFRTGASQDEKKGVYKEIDRRFYEATGIEPGTKISDSPEDKGKRELWLQIQDEVLFQREYIKNLPPGVKRFIKESTSGRVLKPKDFDQLFRIAKTIEKLPAHQQADYLSKISASTTSLDKFESSLHDYQVEAERQKGVTDERDKVQTKLYGLEELYSKYQTYKSYIRGAMAVPHGGGYHLTMQALKIKEEIDEGVKQHGFSGFNDFVSYIHKFEKSYEKEAQNITINLLQRFRGTLFRETEKLNDRATIEGLKQQIDGGASKEDLAKGFSIFNDKDLPDDKKVNLAQLKGLSVDALGRKLRAIAAVRSADLTTALGRVTKDSEVIYKLDKMMPQFYAGMGIAPNSIHDKIIRDKISTDRIRNLIGGILLAIAAIALTVVSLGAATPALIAAGAAAASFGLSAYAVYDEYQKYTLQNDLANAGLADDPSVVWLVIACAGAAIDMAAAVKAVKALGPAAKALDAGGELTDFQKALKALQEAGEIDGKIAQAAEKAAMARKGFGEASKRLLAVGSRLNSNPFLDPEVYIALVQMARMKVMEGVANFSQFALELKKLRVMKGWGEMNPDELLKAKEAWAEGRRLAGLADEVAEVGTDVIAASRARVVAKIGDSGEFVLKYTDDELKAIIEKGKGLGLSDTQIDDFIFTGSRVKKPMTSKEVLAQMDNFVNVVTPRGFPYLFDTIDKFNDFKTATRALLAKYDIPFTEIRVQGSSLRTSAAKDIDLAVFVSNDDFAKFVAKLRKGILERTGHNPKLQKKLIKMLDKNVAQGRVNSFLFDRIAGQTESFNQEMWKLNRFLNDTEKGFDVSVMLNNGSFDMHPYLTF